MGQMRSRLWQPARLVLTALMLAGLLAMSMVGAGPAAAEPPAVGAGSNLVYAPLVLKPVAEWTTIMSENFEGAFPAGWEVFDHNGTDWGEYYWGADTYKPYTGARSAWPARSGADGRDPCCNDYADNMQSWMVYGPFSLAGAARAELLFQLWNQSEAGYDEIAWLASVNNLDYFGQQISGDTGGWQGASLDLTNVYALGNLAGQTQVWIAFVFVSDGTNVGKGPFVDDVLVRKSQFYANAPSGVQSAAPADGVPVALKRGAPLSGASSAAAVGAGTPVVGAGYDRKGTDIRLLNTSATTTANVEFDFYSATGAPAAYNTTVPVAPLGGTSVNQTFTPLAVGFTGGAQISSPQLVLGIVNIGGLRSMMGYTAPTAGATTVYLPAVFKNAYGIWTTNFSVQNTTATAADVTMVYYNLAGTAVHTVTDTIPAYASHVYDQATITQLGAAFVGAAEVTSTQAVTAQVCEESPTYTDGAAYTGFASTAADTTIHAASVLKNAWGWNSDIRVQNPNAAAANITITFYDGAGAVVTTLTDTIPAHAVHGYNQQYMTALGDFFAGSAAVTSSQPVVAIVNEAHTSGAFLSYESVADTAGTTTLYAPSVLKNAWGWTTDVRVRNMGAVATSVTVDFYTFAGVKTHTISDTIPAHAVRGYNEGFITQLGTWWEGWVQVTSASQPVTAIVNEIYTSGDGIAYTAINR